MDLVSIPYVVFMVFAPAQIIYNRKVTNSDDVPAGPTVSNRPSRLNANNILEISWAILVEFSLHQKPARVRSDCLTNISGKGMDILLKSWKSMALHSAMSGDLEVGTLSELRLTLTRFVAAGVGKPSAVLTLLDNPGLADLELTTLPRSDTAL
jgi:hypothetical protein